MKTLLILTGVVLLIAAGALLLAATGRHRIIAPYLASTLGVMLLVSGIEIGRQQHSGAAPPVPGPTSQAATFVPTQDTGAPTPTSAMQPAVSLPALPPDSGCTPFTPGRAPYSPPPGYQGPNLPASARDDVQTLPFEFAPGEPAGGTLVRSTSMVMQNGALDPWIEAAIAPVMQDLYGEFYDDLSLSDTGGMPFVYLYAGTPRAGTCWNELAYDALTNFGGSGHVANVHSEPVSTNSGLARYHAVLLCGQMAEAWDMCAWAGPGKAGGAGIFGMVRVAPDQKVSQSMTDAGMAVFAEKVFDATVPAA